MKEKNNQEIIEEYLSFLGNNNFACVAAREAVARQQVVCFVAENMLCPRDDNSIHRFLSEFVDSFRKEKDIFHSAAIIFKRPQIENEEMFDALMWKRLQSISNLDAERNGYDKRVDSNPASEKFSFSINEEAFFIVGLHPQSSRVTRQFSYAVLTFNPHVQFVRLRENGQYSKLKNIVRKRDIAYSGSINPMLDDFGTSSEVYQYSGMKYDSNWKCPLRINHEPTEYNFSKERSGFHIEERSTP